MENVLSQFSAKNLDIKLTDEKMFINTLTSNEAFALRSLNGIGVIDLLDEYNKELTAWKGRAMVPKILMGFGVFMALMGLFMIAEGGIGSLVFGGIMVVGGYLWMQNIDSKKPEMESVVRIMMSGGNRDFKFNKTGTNSNSIAEFVANVESTLTAYHKKND